MREDDGAFTIAAFCEWAHVGRTFAYELISAGKVNAVKAGGKTLILKTSAKEWLASLPAIASSLPRKAA
jgi:excisionase family DNA binding protein